MTHFGDRLIEASRRCKTPLCMGIDPHPSMIPTLFGEAAAPAGSDAAIRAIDDFAMACVEQAMEILTSPQSSRGILPICEGSALSRYVPSSVIRCISLYIPL